jgi:hemerythrin-like domain-containing protein
MDPLLAAMADDHRHINRLMSCLDAEVFNYLDGYGSELALCRILDALEYMQVYPDRYHHPLENKLFARLKPRVSDPDLLSMLENIEGQHEELESMTCSLQEQFMALANDRDVDREQLADLYRRYSELQREHLQCENKHVFSVLFDYLQAEDYADIRAEMEAAKDPLFSDRYRDHFQSLYDFVVNKESDNDAISVF